MHYQTIHEQFRRYRLGEAFFETDPEKVISRIRESVDTLDRTGVMRDDANGNTRREDAHTVVLMTAGLSVSVNNQRVVRAVLSEYPVVAINGYRYYKGITFDDAVVAWAHEQRQESQPKGRREKESEK